MHAHDLPWFCEQHLMDKEIPMLKENEYELDIFCYESEHPHVLVYGVELSPKIHPLTFANRILTSSVLSRIKDSFSGSHKDWSEDND